MGTRSTGPAAPLATAQTRAVLSSDTVTAQVPVASTATPRTRFTCMPGSTRSSGAMGGWPPPAGTGWAVAGMARLSSATHQAAPVAASRTGLGNRIMRFSPSMAARRGRTCAVRLGSF